MKKRFRTNPVKAFLAPTPSATPRVDVEKGIIYGASAIQSVEALGHNLMADAKTLEQVVSLGNAAAKGIIVRFTHPGMCDDSLGKMAGRMTNFRVEGDKAVGDIRLLDAAAKSPEGDLRGYLLELAASESDAFGMSIVFSGMPAWKLADGSEAPAFAEVEPGIYKRQAKPANAVGDYPMARVDSLRAVDFVGEPAANRDGLFSANFSGTTGDAATAAFAKLDELRESMGMSLEDAADFLNRYLAARQVSAPKKDDDTMTKEQIKALLAAHPDHKSLIADALADGKDEAAIVKAIDEQALSAEKAKTVELATKLASAETALAALKTEHEALKAQHAALSAVGKQVAPKDPGANPTAPIPENKADALKGEWEAMPPSAKKLYFDNIDVFVNAKALEAEEAASGKKAD